MPEVGDLIVRRVDGESTRLAWTAPVRVPELELAPAVQRDYHPLALRMQLRRKSKRPRYPPNQIASGFDSGARPERQSASTSLHSWIRGPIDPVAVRLERAVSVVGSRRSSIHASGTLRLIAFRARGRALAAVAAVDALESTLSTTLPVSSRRTRRPAAVGSSLKVARDTWSSAAQTFRGASSYEPHGLGSPVDRSPRVWPACAAAKVERGGLEPPARLGLAD